MGVYWHIANDTKRQFLHDHQFHRIGQVGGHGVDFGSILSTPFGSLQLLALLLASDVSFGERETPDFTGEWRGDRIGFYSDAADSVHYERVCEEYEDITPRLLQSLLTSPHWKEHMQWAHDTIMGRTKDQPPLVESVESTRAHQVIQTAASLLHRAWVREAIEELDAYLKSEPTLAAAPASVQSPVSQQESSSDAQGGK